MEDKSRTKVAVYVRGEDKGEDRVGFMHKDFAPTRRIVEKEWARTTLILFVGILSILSIFWGAFLQEDIHIKRLKAFVVNFDSTNDGIVGTNIVRVAETLSSSEDPHLGWEVVSAASFDNDPIKVRLAVYNFEAWVAVIINANASSALQRAAETGDTNYYPDGAAEIVYVGARDTYAMPNFVVPDALKFQIKAIDSVGQAWARSVLANSSIESQRLIAAPQILNPAIGFTSTDLRPLGPKQVIPAVTVGALYLIVVSFFSFAFFLPTHTHFVSEIEGHRKLYFYQLVIWKYLSAVCAYFFLSLSYSLVSLAFQIPFANQPASPTEPAINPTAYGRASFFVYWMVNWLGMITLGLASENMAMVLGQPWAALWLVFWIITNVCTTLYPIDIAPRFYYYGYAFPLHQIIEASKQILFDLHSRIGLNVGVLLAWWAVDTAMFPVCAWIFRWKYFRGLRLAKKRSK